MDDLDVKLVELLTERPGLPVVECSRRLGVARVTVQNRLNKLHESGVVTGIVPRLDPAAMGYGLLAICTLEIEQRIGHEPTAAEIARVPEVLDLYTTTGSADMIARIVARSTRDLQRVLDVLSQLPGVARVSSQIALNTHFSDRTLPLLRRAGGQ